MKTIVKNYARTFFCIIFFLFIHLDVAIASSNTQSPQSCNIISELEPIITKDFRFPFYSQNVSCTNEDVEWTTEGKALVSNNQYTSIVLSKESTSTCLTLNNFYFNLPYGAEINGIKVEIEGYAEGSEHISTKRIQLIDESGLPVGQNKAGAPSVGEEWATEESTWKYGYGSDTWNHNWNYDQINDSNFGLVIQIENTSSLEEIKAFINQVKIIISYTPLFTICNSHDCFALYVDADNTDRSYQWVIPEEFDFRSESSTESIVNIGFGNADVGNYSICVEIFENGELIDECCREMIVDDCNPGELGNFVWQDINADGVQNQGEIGMPGVKVSLLDIKLKEIAATVTDNLGYYSFENIMEGAYIISFSEPTGFFFSPVTNNVSELDDSDVSHAFGLGTTDIVNLSANENLENVDAGVIEGAKIGDKVWEDINGNGIYESDEPGIPGVVISLYDYNDNFLAQTTTDEEGIYEFPKLLNGSYYLKVSIPSGFQMTAKHQGNNDIDNDFDQSGISTTIELFLGEKITNVDAGMFILSKIGDFVWNDENRNGIQDNIETGLADMPVFLMRSNGSLAKETITSKEGNYLFTNIVPGTYFVIFDALTSLTASPFLIGTEELDSDISNTNGLNTTENFKIVSGTTNYSMDAGFVPKLGSISGTTWNDLNYNGVYENGEELLPEILVQLYNSNDELIKEAYSNSEGFFQFIDLFAGFYYLKFEILSDFEFTFPGLGSGETNSDVNEMNGPGTTSSFEVIVGLPLENVSSGYVGFSKIGDQIWQDDNENGVQDESEEGVNGVIVQLFQSNGELISETVSDVNIQTGKPGFYLFEGILPGDYYLLFDTELEFTDSFSGQNNEFDSDISGEFGPGTTSVYSILSSQEILTIDAGLLPLKGNISGICWIDSDRDGVRENGEPTLENIAIQLFDKNGNFIKSTLSNFVGEYLFTDLIEGSYYIVFELPDHLEFTQANSGSNSNDNNVTGSITNGSTDLIEVNNGNQIVNVDAGYLEELSIIGDRVWIDDNSNGIQDDNESGAPNIKVFLFDATATLVGSQITDENGKYEFIDVTPGVYFLSFNPDANYIFTKSKIGSNDAIDSDVTNALANGTTNEFTVIAGEDIDYLDAGIFELASIGDFVWLDTNNDGLQQDNEEGINGITLQLFDELGNFIISTQSKVNPESGASGFYEFSQISPGEYKILIDLPLGFNFTSSFSGNENIDSDIANVVNGTGATDIITLLSGETTSSIDFGFFEPIKGTASIGDFVWYDSNSDGIQNENEFGLNNIEVLLYNDAGVEMGYTITSNHPETGNPGYYQFENLNAGAYYIVIFTPQGMTLAEKEQGPDSAIDSDFSVESGQFRTSVLNLIAGEIKNDIDAGLLFDFAKIGDFAWIDSDKDGIQDASEIGVNEILVELYTWTGDLVNSTFTSNNSNDQSGFYLFDQVIPGAYYLKFISEEEFPFSGADLGGNDTRDSDVTNSNGFGTTNIFGIGSGETDIDIDAGLQIPGRYTKPSLDSSNREYPDIKTYPNPVYNYFDLNLSNIQSGIAKISVYDLTGTPIADLSREIKLDITNTSRVDLSSCAPGIYIVRIQLNGQLFTKIIVKQDL